MGNSPHRHNKKTKQKMMSMEKGWDKILGGIEGSGNRDNMEKDILKPIKRIKDQSGKWKLDIDLYL